MPKYLFVFVLVLRRGCLNCIDFIMPCVIQSDLSYLSLLNLTFFV